MMLDNLILTFVQQHDIREQSGLQDLLKAAGYEVPQATLSRRLKRLKIAKVGGVYQAVGAPLPALPPLLKIQISELGLIVLHTHPGHANSLAYFLDQKYVSKEENGLLGTIAGDDTVLVITQGKAVLPPILAALKADFPSLTLPL